MPKPPLDQEDFQAWRDHPVTQWVMGRLKAEAERNRQQLARDVLALSLTEPATWVSRQPSIAVAAAHIDRLFWFAENMSLEDLEDPK